MLIEKWMWRQISSMVGLALLAFLFLLAFVDLLDQLNQVTSTGYTFSRALLFVSLGLPTYFYEIAPVAVLIGAVVALSQMAGHSEYVVLRASGFAKYRALFILLRLGLVGVVVIFLVGELLAPASLQKGQQMRLSAQGGSFSGQLSSGIWLKDRQAKNTYILNAADISSAETMRQVVLYTFDTQGQLQKILRAQSAEYLGANRWRLNQVAQTEWQPAKNESARLASSQLPTLEWVSEITPDTLAALFLEPERMSLWRLYRTTRYLANTGQDNMRYQAALYRRTLYPFSILIMLFLALPFAYFQGRQIALGSRIFVAILIGVVFLNVNAFFSHWGLLNQWPPIWVAASPSLLFMAITFVTLFWVDRR